ncbi:MAG: M14 family zinc carboxypeptidase, partial [Candidatus Thorarchaeota archaeon]
FTDALGNLPGNDIALYGGSFGPFHNKTELYNKLYSIEENFPNLVEIKEIGISYKGNPILAIILTNELKTINKDDFLLVAHHHGREIITIENVLYFVDRLIYDYISGVDDVQKLFDVKRIHIIPSLNIDTLDMLHLWPEQRKNLRPVDEDGDGIQDENEILTGLDGPDADNTTGEDKPGGIDLNRNYPYKWGEQYGTDDPTSAIYRGKYPLSEPETQAMVNYVRNNYFKTAVTLHAGLETIIVPWFYDPEKICPDFDTFNVIGEELESLTGLDYTKLPYNLSGVWLDWMYGARGIFAINFETYRNSSTTYLWDWSNPPANKVIENCEIVVYPGLEFMVKYNPPKLNIIPTENMTTIIPTDETNNINHVIIVMVFGFLLAIRKKKKV